MGKASANGKSCKGLKMTNFWSKYVALLKNKIVCAGVYCVTLIELQAHRDAFIQKTVSLELARCIFLHMTCGTTDYFYF